jgi:uncharacterized integral membrane protein (TIGR00698 family)
LILIPNLYWPCNPYAQSVIIPFQQKGEMLKKISFILLALICLWTRIDSSIALLGGILFNIILTNPFPILTVTWSKRLLQLSVVGLGFGVGIGQVLQVGKHSIVYTVISITFTLIAGVVLGKLFKVTSNTSQLISFGTAICGGSAIAALAPVIHAKTEEIAISLATIFTLNSAALLLFPHIGHFMNLSQHSFGLWAALAIHDTSSVVGAASTYGSVALATGTMVKLTRALWITPFVLGVALLRKSGTKATLPFFIIGFIAAAITRSLFPQQSMVWDLLVVGARRLLVVTLFLIGTGLSKAVLKKVGVRPLAQAVALWILISVVTLLAVTQNVIL